MADVLPEKLNEVLPSGREYKLALSKCTKLSGGNSERPDQIMTSEIRT